MSSDELSVVRMMCVMLIIPTVLVLIWSIVSLTCGSGCVDSDMESAGSHVSSVSLTRMFGSSRLLLVFWYVGWFAWLLCHVWVCFSGPMSTYKMLGMFGNALLSLMWWIMVLEYSRGPFRGFTFRRICSLLLHRLLLFMWLLSLYVVLRVSSTWGLSWVLTMYAWLFVLFHAFVWELMFVRHLTRVEDESPW